MQGRCTELVEVYLGPLKNTMHEAQGHIANWRFVPEGTRQSVEKRAEKVRWGYRFGFQGQEKDDEIYGATGTALSFEYRIHDPRVGRFLSLDPLAAKYAWNSPYAFSENRVIGKVELEGLETSDPPLSCQEYLTGTPRPQSEDEQLKQSAVNFVSMDKIEAFRRGQTEGWTGKDYVDLVGQFSGFILMELAGAGAEQKALATLRSGPEVVEATAPMLRVTTAASTAQKAVSRLGPEFITSATAETGTQGLTQVGRALQKHAGRAGSAFEAIGFSHKTGNAQGLQVLQDIMKSDNLIMESAEQGGQQFFDKATGRGFAVSREGKFNGFRELPKTTSNDGG